MSGLGLKLIATDSDDENDHTYSATWRKQISEQNGDLIMLNKSIDLEVGDNVTISSRNEVTCNSIDQLMDVSDVMVDFVDQITNGNNFIQTAENQVTSEPIVDMSETTVYSEDNIVVGDIITINAENQAISDRFSDITDITSNSLGEKIPVEDNITVLGTDKNNNETNYCRHCEKSFSTKSNFKRHSKKHKGSIRCHIAACKKAFANNSELKRHVETHSSDKTFQCSFCIKKFKSKRGLTIHVKEHIGVYRYLCPQCGRGFNFKTDFEGHTASHSGVKPYSCQKCCKSFTYKNYFKLHCSTCGTSRGNFECGICGRFFKQKRYLDDHFKALENDKRYQCAVCGAFFKYRASLYKHMKNFGHK